DKITICAPEKLLNIQVDQLLANIFMIPLLKLHKNFTTLLKPQGEILLSGILAPQSEQIFNTYADDFDLTVADRQDEWLLLRGIKKNI
ncbi:MAG: 50S ribosomal protein L11 methyltransferase, partial [Gammaproteobacteria bacterium]